VIKAYKNKRNKLCWNRKSWVKRKRRGVQL